MSIAQWVCLIYWHSISIRAYFLHHMNKYDQTFEPSVWAYSFYIMSDCDQTFHPTVVIGRCDLISWFSYFTLYLITYSVYVLTSFTIWVNMTRPLTQNSWRSMWHICMVHKLLNHEIRSQGPIYLDRYLVYDHTFSHYEWIWLDLRLKVTAT